MNLPKGRLFAGHYRSTKNIYMEVFDQLINDNKLKTKVSQVKIHKRDLT